MKRKHFTQPPHLTTFGHWLFAQLFKRNITINEMAAMLDVQATTLRGYMIKPDKIPAYRVLQICAILSPTVMHYHNMVPEAMRALPNYYTIYNQQQQPQDKTCQQ
jgi:hypothetical protein